MVPYDSRKVINHIIHAYEYHYVDDDKMDKKISLSYKTKKIKNRKKYNFCSKNENN